MTLAELFPGFVPEAHEHAWSEPATHRRGDDWDEEIRACTGTWYGKPCPISTATLIHNNQSRDEFESA